MATRKAYTSARMGLDCGAYGDRLRESGSDIKDLGDPMYTGVGGGLCIRVGGRVVGAIGVSGRSSEEDQELARAAPPEAPDGEHDALAQFRHDLESPVATRAKIGVAAGTAHVFDAIRSVDTGARALEIGSTAPDFQLTTLDGKAIALADATRTHKAVAVIFIATKCPYSNAYNARMKELAAAYEAVTGRFPYQGHSPLEMLTLHLTEEPQPPSELATMPRALEQLILRR